MNTFPRQLLILATAVLLLLTHQSVRAEEWNLEEKPWEKFGANFGVFMSTTDTSFRVGSGVGLDIDVEELLDLDTTSTVFRTDALWRFSKNRRHRLDFTWFAFKRDGTKQIGQDITIEDGDGNPITIDAGTTVNAFFDLDIYEVAYSYSFFQDDRIDLAAGLGLYIMPLDFGLKATGLIDEEGSAKFTAPLPVLGLRMDFALTPQWFIRTGSQIFYLKYENFSGSVLEFRAALEYNPWKHVGIGLGFDSLVVKVEADGQDYPEIDFKGNVEFNYTGFQLYLRIFY
jgi:hypothetical protein